MSKLLRSLFTARGRHSCVWPEATLFHLVTILCYCRDRWSQHFFTETKDNLIIEAVHEDVVFHYKREGHLKSSVLLYNYRCIKLRIYQYLIWSSTHVSLTLDNNLQISD